MESRTGRREVQEGVGKEMAAGMRERLTDFLQPVREELDEVLDVRLVRTMVRGVEAILENRDGRNGLLLSELGGYITDGAHAPAGTKRLGNLIRSEKWSGREIEAFLAEKGNERIADLVTAGETALAIWDESVLEKPGSLKPEGLSPVRSSTVGWMSRIKPGYYRPPSAPVFVPGMPWASVIVAGMTGAPTLHSMRWWSTRGEQAEDKRSVIRQMLLHCDAKWGQRVVHTFDRGFAGAPWLGFWLEHAMRFVVRWQTNYKLLDEQGKERKPFEITRGKRSQAFYMLERSDGSKQQIGVYCCPVRHPAFPDRPLYLVVSRPGKGRKPWYLLTSEPTTNPEQAWRIIRAYARRWQIEMSFRFQKSELALESPRIYAWRHRIKLLLLVSLAYAFLLSLLSQCHAHLRNSLLDNFDHRTGKRCRETPAPLYRLRHALARLWLAFPLPFVYLNSG